MRIEPDHYESINGEDVAREIMQRQCVREASFICVRSIVSVRVCVCVDGARGPGSRTTRTARIHEIITN